MAEIRVFISSVQAEFVDERQRLCNYIRQDALLGRFFIPFIFEELPAINTSAQEAYLAEAGQCDIYLGLYGEHYGYEDEEGISPTEREYDVATQQHKHRILNPGTLPYGMTIPQLSQLHSSVPTNPVLAHPIYLAGYIERMGTGTTDIIEQCEAMGLPTPTFMQDSFFQVTLYRKQQDNKRDQKVLEESKAAKPAAPFELNTRQRLVCVYCRLPRTSRQILNHIGVSYHSTNIKKYINDLVDVKLLRVVNGGSRNSKDVMYVKC